MAERGNERDGPRLVLLCGLPGSGKTTRARRLAAEVPAVRAEMALFDPPR